MKRSTQIVVALAALVFLTGAANVLGNVLRPHRVATASFPAASALLEGGLLFDTTTSQLKRASASAWNPVNDGPVTLSSQPASGALAAISLGGGVLPARAFTATAIRFRISAAGVAGTTNNVVRISDGTNNCDASFACNSAVANYRITTTGACNFAASASLTYSVNAIGDCASPTTVLGAVDIEGEWR